jgi:AefR-like transcriptional repressor, C-terminal domain
MLAAHQFIGMLNELSLWPWMMGREGLPVSAEDAVEETIRMFLQRYRRPQSKEHDYICRMRMKYPERLAQVGLDVATGRRERGQKPTISRANDNTTALGVPDAETILRNRTGARA